MRVVQFRSPVFAGADVAGGIDQKNQVGPVVNYITIPAGNQTKSGQGRARQRQTGGEHKNQGGGLEQIVSRLDV